MYVTNRDEESCSQSEQRQDLLTGRLLYHEVVADTVAKELPRESGSHVLYNRLTPCFLLIAGRSGQAPVSARDTLIRQGLGTAGIGDNAGRGDLTVLRAIGVSRVDRLQ